MSTLVAPSLERMRVRGVASGRSCERPVELLRRRDLDLLAWVGEQYAARADQLEPLIGAGPRTVQRVLARLRAARMLDTRRVLVDEPAWVLPTGVGLRACGCGFGVWLPRIGLLAHVRAVNDVRLHVEARSPAAQWVCERQLVRDRAAGEHLPDGVILLEGQRLAVEVELTVKSRARTSAILDDLAARFDAVLYFCAPGAHRQLSELACSGRWPALGVRELPARA